jgi:hypothetical protein
MAVMLSAGRFAGFSDRQLKVTGTKKRCPSPRDGIPMPRESPSFGSAIQGSKPKRRTVVGEMCR